MKKRFTKRLVAVVVTLALIAQMFTFGAFAAEPVVDNRVVDPSTMTDWQNYFGKTVLNTENAGGVWGDKSVFLNADDFNAALEDGINPYNIDFTEKGDNFLVALSAIASNKSIVGYSAIPTDTIFVLDLSNSMSNASMTSMINSTNTAIKKLNDLNLNNRIGVVVYAGTRASYNSDTYGLTQSATVLLPLDRYEGVGNNNATFLNYSNDTVSVARGVLANNRTPSKAANGATYIQAGIQLAVDEFNDVTDTVITSGPQAGTVRMPVMVLMSDGAPTAATASFNNVGTSQFGTGSSSSTSAREVYLTQLSCAYAKNVMQTKYGRAPLFYTLGLNVGNSAYAMAILDPQNASTPYTTLWNEYVNAQNGSSANITQTVRNSQNNAVNFTVPVVKGLEKNYVTENFLASSDTALVNAFGSIVNQIIIQSKYYPTLVDDGKHHLNGYITFNDELGPFMQVKDIKGITVDGKLYPGSAIAKEIFSGTLGDISGGNLDNLNEEGRAFLVSIESRLGITADEAKSVASQAIKDGQLYYNSATGEFSNYIGWYADANGKYIGYWNGVNYNYRPANAVYANKSYGFMGTVGSDEEFNKTDMLHISVQIHEHIDKAHQTVIYKIPAALIPTVNYEITFDGDSLENGTNFKMSVNGADEPIRLLFEVGLRDDINRINVAEKVAEYEAEVNESYPHKNNGVYTFYSNAWREHTHEPSVLVDSHDAAWLKFEPSKENERYYYTHNALIYELDGTTYKLVTADPRNENSTYYTQVAVFTTSSTALDSATMEYKYVPIHKDTIKLAIKNNDNTWYIPKDTVHRLLEDPSGHDFHIAKVGEDLTTATKEHPTKTLNYSNYPAVVFLDDGTVHADACLGNNGTFSITQASGIKLTKSVEVDGLGANEEFTFNIALTAPAGSTLANEYPVYDANGIYIADALVISGTITYNLKPGETIYIADLPVGTTYTVTESLKQGWTVGSKTNDTGTVLANAFNNVEFLNLPVSHGNLMIHKDVVLPNNIGVTEYNGEFELEVTFTSATPFTNVSVNGTDTAVVNNKLTGLTIKDGETILISGIPEGTTVDVKEVNKPSFWRDSYTQNRTTIHEDINTIVTVTNTYDVASAHASFNHNGIKNLIGREWLNTDKFEFSLEYFDGTHWVPYNEVRTVLGTQNAKTFSFTDYIGNMIFDKAGVHQFRIVELPTEIGGVNYDYIPKRFEVEVVNNFNLGKLEIASVTTATPMTTGENPYGTDIALNNGTYTITTVFNNRYGVTGTADALINIQKVLENQTGINRDLSGFEFELYQLDGQNQKINVEKIGPTNASGNLQHVKSFGADLVGETLTYYLAEVNLAEDGVKYDTAVKEINIKIVDNLDGSVSANVNGSGSNEYNATFTNKYEFNAAEVELNGTKKMTGRELLATDEIYFELYKTDENFANEVLTDTQKQANGQFTFRTNESTVGKKYYIIKEKATNLPGVKDDTAVYKITVNVEKGTGDNLTYNIESILKDNAPVTNIEFVNTYTPNLITKVILGEKNLTGRDIVNGEFKFTLKDNSGAEIETVEVKDGKFQFAALEFTAAGEYLYTVEEVKLNDADVTYDETVYNVKIVVTDDGLATLTPTVTITNKTDGAVAEKIVFNNVYTAPTPEPTPTPNPNPPMGDTANIFLWFAVAFISGGLTLVTGILGKRKQVEE